MQHSFLELRTAILALSQKCLGAIHSATSVLDIDMTHVLSGSLGAFHNATFICGIAYRDSRPPPRSPYAQSTVPHSFQKVAWAMLGLERRWRP